LQVLTGDATRFSWEQSSDGKLVSNALATDKIEDEKVYIGRAPISDSLMIGKIQPPHRCLHIPYDGREHRMKHYEVLVHRKKPQLETLIDLGQVECEAGAVARVNASSSHQNALIPLQKPASRRKHTRLSQLCNFSFLFPQSNGFIQRHAHRFHLRQFSAGAIATFRFCSSVDVDTKVICCLVKCFRLDRLPALL
jgi:hypothetical protein